MKILELYSGIGGMHYAFRESGVEGNVVAAVEINTVANEVYRNNFPNVRLLNRNIQSLQADEINKLNIDTILMSPPCQPFTRVGLQKDAADKRTDSLFHVLQLIPQIKTLNYLLLENVKGFENSQTRSEIVECLKNCDFNLKELILSPSQFGIPNTRHRYYLLAKKKKLKFCFPSSDIEYDLGQTLLEDFSKKKHTVLTEKHGVIDPKTGKQCYELSQILEHGDQSSFLISKRQLQRRAWILDIRTAKSTGSCCFTKAYGHYVEGTGSVYCPFSQHEVEQKYAECAQLEKHSEEEVSSLLSLNLRYFTPKEVSRLMCFPEDFKFPKDITNKQKYRLLGNSVNVHVISVLISLLYSDIKYCS